MKRIILDTNFLLMPIQSGIDIYTKLEEMLEDVAARPCAPKAVFDELKGMAGKKDKKARLAKASLELAIKRKVEEVPSGKGSPDSEIVALAQPGDFVCTNDNGIAKKLREKNVTTIGARNNGTVYRR